MHIPFTDISTLSAIIQGNLPALEEVSLPTTTMTKSLEDRNAFVPCSAIPVNLKNITQWGVTYAANHEDYLFVRDQCQSESDTSKFELGVRGFALANFNFEKFSYAAVKPGETNVTDLGKDDNGRIVELLNFVKNETLKAIALDPNGADLMLGNLTFRRSWAVNQENSHCVDSVFTSVRDLNHTIRNYCIPRGVVCESPFSDSMFMDLPAQISQNICTNLTIHYDMATGQPITKCVNCQDPYKLRSDYFACKHRNQVNETAAPNATHICQWNREQTFYVFQDFFGRDDLNKWKPGYTGYLSNNITTDEKGCLRNVSALDGQSVALSFLRSASLDTVRLCLTVKQDNVTLSAVPCTKPLDTRFYFKLNETASFSVGNSSYQIFNSQGVRLIDSVTKKGGFVFDEELENPEPHFDPSIPVEDGFIFMVHLP